MAPLPSIYFWRKKRYVWGLFPNFNWITSCCKKGKGTKSGNRRKQWKFTRPGVGVQPCRVLREEDIGQGLLHYRSHAPRVGINKQGGQQLTQTTLSKKFFVVQKNNKVCIEGGGRSLLHCWGQAPRASKHGIQGLTQRLRKTLLTQKMFHVLTNFVSNDWFRLWCFS